MTTKTKKTKTTKINLCGTCGKDHKGKIACPGAKKKAVKASSKKIKIDDKLDPKLAKMIIDAQVAAKKQGMAFSVGRRNGPVLQKCTKPEAIVNFLKSRGKPAFIGEIERDLKMNCRAAMRLLVTGKRVKKSGTTQKTVYSVGA